MNLTLSIVGRKVQFSNDAKQKSVRCTHPRYSPSAATLIDAHMVHVACNACIQAFAYNFLSALSAVLGTIIIMSLGNKLTDAQISIFLLLGAGSFIFIALSELLPEALVVTYTTVKHGDSSVAGSQLRKLASFLFGALVIGATLIVDRECDVGGGDNH